MKRSITLFLKTSTGCNAGCKSCPAGRKEPDERELSGKMSAEMFRRIIDYILPQANITSIVLHYYNEPTLNSEIPEMIKYARSKRIPTFMSTNGSYPDKLSPFLKAGLDNLIVSTSGYTQAIHERSHKNTDIELIKNKTFSQIYFDKLPHTVVRIGWHNYKYNLHEREQMRKLANWYGFLFTPYDTSLLDVERAHRQVTRLMHDPTAPDDPGEVDLMTKMRESMHLCAERKHFNCIYQDAMILVDATGHLWNCPAKVKEHNKRMSLFSVSINEFMYQRRFDPDCIACKKDGMHVYAMQMWRRGLDWKATIFRKLEDLWRWSGIAGYVPWFTRWWGKMSYSRPQHETKNQNL